jgi:hypothetical protein
MTGEGLRLKCFEVKQVYLSVSGITGGYLLFGDSGEIDFLAPIIHHLIPNEGVVVKIKTEVAASLPICQSHDTMTGGTVDPFGRHRLPACWQYRLRTD